MQDRRYRPGDVLDDYCPRERRITDHAIVAMIDDEIRRTRCGICDAEHEYKEGKVPTPRRKTQPPALFTQVLDGDATGRCRRPHSPPPAADGAADSTPQPAMHGSAPAGRAAASRRRRPETPPAFGTPTMTPRPNRRAARGRGRARRRFPPIADTRHVPAARRTGADAPRDSRIHDSIPEQSTQQRRPASRRRRQNKFRGGAGVPAGGGSQDNLGPMRFRDHGTRKAR